MSMISLAHFTRADGSSRIPREPRRGLSRRASVERLTTSDRQEGRRLLCDCVLFRRLASHERNALAARAHISKFEAGETIFLMGALNDSMIAVLDGAVRISMATADGKEIVFAIVRAGEVFGEIAMLDGKPRSADAKALTTCKVAVLNRADVMAVLARNPTAWLGLVEVLCARLRQTDQHLVEVALLGLAPRLAKALLRVVGEQDARARNGVADIRLSQMELANIVGAARENVNKYLQEWQRAGLIRMEKRVITIADRAGLEAVANPD